MVRPRIFLAPFGRKIEPGAAPRRGVVYLEGPNQGGGVPRLGVASVGKVRQGKRNQGGGRFLAVGIHKGACLCDFPASLAVGVVSSRPGGLGYFLPAYGKNIFCHFTHT